MDKAKKIHFIGIGGIGISAVAQLFALEGKQVTGSDRSASEVTEALEKKGIKVFIGQKVENIPADCDMVVYTVAILEDNPEFVEAERRGLPMFSYPQTLEFISRKKYTIAVSGTHGKTTVTAMIAKVLMDADKDPSVIVGSLIKSLKSNYVAGKSDLLVVEADEYKKSFHNLYPSVLVINAIDLDHLDFYKDLADIQTSFRELAERVPKNGAIVYDGSDPNIFPVIAGLKCKLLDYTPYVGKVKLAIAGKHNRENAAAAHAVCAFLDVPEKAIIASLETFENTWRRFELKGKTKSGALVYDDYAHNPQKVRAALQGAREQFPKANITVIFQPHLYSRTKSFLKEFGESFSDADTVLVLPIYAAREENDPSITSELLAQEIKKHNPHTFFVEAKGAVNKARQEAGAGDVILLMGAGDVNELSSQILS